MKNKVLKAVILTVVCAIPIIYSFFYLKAYWDPYGNLQDLKIAMVNLDEGYEGENQGKNLIDQMTENGTFTICDVSESAGDEGLKNGEYYAEIKIPKDFSKNLNSADKENKQISEIIYSPNQKSNYLASQIINSALKTVQLNLQSKVSEKVTEKLSEKLNEVPESLTEISDGAGELLDGSNTLSDGIRTLDEGANKLKNGTDSAYKGSLEIKNRVEKSISNLQNDNSDALDEAMKASIGAQAQSSAEEQIQNRVEEIEASAGSMAVAQITQNSEQIGSKAAGVAESQISDYMESKSEEIGESAKAKAIEEINAQMEMIQESATNSAVAGIQSKKDYISGLASSGFTPEKIAELNGLVQLGLQSNENFNNLPEEMKPIVIQFAQASALSVAKATASETAVATSENVAALVAPEVAKSVAQQVAGSVSKDVATQVSKQVSGEVAKQVASSTAQTVASEVAGSVASQTAQTVAGEVAGSVANQTAQAVAGEVANGVKQNAVSTIAGQMGALDDGLGSLVDGLNQINNGTESLADGAKALYDGSQELAGGVDTLKTAVDDGNKDTKKDLKKLEGLSEFTSDPVKFDEKDYGKIDQYGLSFTPLFLSIGLWVGSLMLYVVLYYDQDKRFKLLCRGAEKTYLQIALYFALAIVQGLATGVILQLALHFEVTNPLLYYFTCSLTAVTFLSIIQFLIMNFGDVGKFLALIILVLQLAASGGTFPVETVSKGFQALNPYLPMTYSIKLIKECVVMQDTGFAIKNIAILSLYFIITLGITIGAEYFRRLRRKQNQEQNVESHPQNA